MTDDGFDDRLAASGLRPTAGDLPMLQSLVSDLDRAAASVRGPRPYGEEPLSAFRLPRP